MRKGLAWFPSGRQFSGRNSVFTWQVSGFQCARNANLYGSIAQLEERLTVNQIVAGSSPAVPALRNVVQFGRTLGLGPRSHKFESCHSDSVSAVRRDSAEEACRDHTEGRKFESSSRNQSNTQWNRSQRLCVARETDCALLIHRSVSKY